MKPTMKFRVRDSRSLAEFWEGSDGVFILNLVITMGTKKRRKMRKEISAHVSFHMFWEVSDSLIGQYWPVQIISTAEVLFGSSE